MLELPSVLGLDSNLLQRINISEHFLQQLGTSIIKTAEKNDLEDFKVLMSFGDTWILVYHVIEELITKLGEHDISDFTDTWSFYKHNFLDMANGYITGAKELMDKL